MIKAIYRNDFWHFNVNSLGGPCVEQDVLKVTVSVSRILANNANHSKQGMIAIHNVVSLATCFPENCLLLPSTSVNFFKILCSFTAYFAADRCLKLFLVLNSFSFLYCFLFQFTEMDVLLSCNFGYHQVFNTDHQKRCFNWKYTKTRLEAVFRPNPLGERFFQTP